MERLRLSIQGIAIASLCATLAACQADLKTAKDVEGDSAAGPSETLEGTAQLFVADYKDHSETQYFIDTADGPRIRVNFESDPGTLQPGEYLALAGHWNSQKSTDAPTFSATQVLKHLGVDHNQAAGGIGSTSQSVTAVSGAPRAPLLHRVAVILLGTPSATREQVLAQVNQTQGSAGSYITEASGGTDSFEGQVFGPYNVDTSNCASRVDEIANLAKAAAAAAGQDLSKFNKLAFLIGRGADCGWGGLGQLGSPGDTGQLYTWYNDWFECGIVAHEVGHNLGMNHAHSTACGNTMYAQNRAGCTDAEYGDPFDVMGYADCARVGHYSTPQKQYLGWFESCEDVTAGGAAVFNLSPSEGACGVRSVRIPIPGESNYYYLEYRKKSVGQFGGTQGADRVILSVSTDGARVRPNLYRLDATLGSNGGHHDGSLTVGTSYSLPGNVQIRLLEQGDVARVQVTMPQGAGAKCQNGEVPAADTSGNIGMGCGDGCPSDPNKTTPGFCGCGVADIDTDNDGVRDCNDTCPSDPNKTAPGSCGCGKLELSCGGSAAGLIRTHYNGTWSTLPNFNQLTADAAPVVVSAIDVNSYAGTDNFGVVFTGGIQINTAGTYDFELGSDDGSRLRIDDREVVLNDGLHGFAALTGSIALTAGAHAIRVEFFERDGGENLRLRYRTNGAAFADIPGSLLVHPTATDADQCPADPNKTAPGLCGCGKAEGSCGGGSPVITASGENLPYEGKTKAFDGLTNTKWLAFASSTWIQYQYPGTTTKTVTRYSITSANDVPARDPKNWRLLGSNDGISWTVMDTRSSQTFSARAQTRTFTVASPRAFRMYRLSIRSNLDPLTASATQLAELALTAAP